MYYLLYLFDFVCIVHEYTSFSIRIFYVVMI